MTTTKDAMSRQSKPSGSIQIKARPFVSRSTTGPPACISRNNVHYLYPGLVVVSRDAMAIKTILGSCVAVGLWDPVQGVGGLNHFLLPYRARFGAPSSTRFGNVAMEELLSGLLKLGARRSRLKAKVFGGARVLEAFKESNHLGKKNIEMAKTLLAQGGIPLVDLDVGGKRGRRVLFETATGAAKVVLL